MDGALDMTLDDLIKTNKKSVADNSRRPKLTGPGPGPARRFPTRDLNRSAPYTTKAPESSAWKHDMYVDQGVGYSLQDARPSSIETGTKLYISNLDYGVSNEDIKELFAEVGDLKRCTIHYDRSGRSKGTAEVVFSSRLDAVAAVKRYNNVQLDGKPMKIDIVGTNIATPAVHVRTVAPVYTVTNGNFGNSNVFSRGGQRERVAGWMRDGGRVSRGRGGRGRGKGRDEKFVSAVDLDADLDKYHSQAMQTN